MTDKSKHIYDLLITAKHLTSTFAHALHQYPKAKRFTIVATKTERTFAFVPSHLDHLVADSVKIASIERPEALTKKAIAQQIYHTCAVLVDQMKPSLMFTYRIDELLLTKRLRFAPFTQVSNLVDISATLDQSLKDQADDLYIKYVDVFMIKTQDFLNELDKSGLDIESNPPPSCPTCPTQHHKMAQMFS